MWLVHATSGNTHGKIPHFSFLSFKELCGQELSRYWTDNIPRRN